MKKEYVNMLIKAGVAVLAGAVVIVCGNLVENTAGSADKAEATTATAEAADTESAMAEAGTEAAAEGVSAYATRADVTYVTAEAPAASNANDVVTADDWASTYPEIYESYQANSDNNYTVSYLEESPYLVNLYEGYGFAKDYNSAEGHAYVLQDVAATERPHALANCLTCKTADFTALVNKLGTEAYSMDFEEVYGQVSENVGCYSCHENQEGNNGELVLTHDYTQEALGDEMADGTIDAATLVCAQCHTEYYFDGNDNKATSVPYTDIESMDPATELAYYDELGFSDWTQESTGANLIKVQHPEVETFLGEGSVHASMGLTCADCHMATETAEDGTVYVSHKMESPLENEAILNTCTQCHGDTDMTEKVHAIQEQVTAREDEVGNELSDLNDKLTDAVASGNYTEDELNQIRSLYRTAQWYFDYDYVENSEGAHNSTMANKLLDTAEDYVNQADALFK